MSHRCSSYCISTVCYNTPGSSQTVLMCRWILFCAVRIYGGRYIVTWYSLVMTKMFKTVVDAIMTFLYGSLTFQADDKLTIFFSYFSKKIGFHISCKFSPQEAICMKCLKPIFWEKYFKRDRLLKQLQIQF